MVVEEKHATEDCPPASADRADGVVFRCCKNSPPKPEDMRTHEETGRLPDADSCIRRSLSVFRSQDDARHQIRLFERWSKKFLAQTTLQAEHGHTMPTPTKDRPTHTSWWPAPDLDAAGRAALFTVIEEVVG